MALVAQIPDILFYISMAFIGYSIGRIGHVLGGHLKSPHHWIYGLALVIVGIFFYGKFLGVSIISFGIGLFISDLKDFLNMEIYGMDKVKKRKFWRID
jgi:hypothetical protein